MRTLFIVFTCLSVTIFTAPNAEAFSVGRGAAAIARAVGDCSNPCTIQASNGGRIVDFEDAGNAIRAGARQKLVISGYCASACMVMADRARPRACITSNATFLYHKTNYNRPIPLSGCLRGWCLAHGAFPSFTGPPGIRQTEVARHFWPMCSTQPSL